MYLYFNKDLNVNEGVGWKGEGRNADHLDKIQKSI